MSGISTIKFSSVSSKKKKKKKKKKKRKLEKTTPTGNNSRKRKRKTKKNQTTPKTPKKRKITPKKAPQQQNKPPKPPKKEDKKKLLNELSPLEPILSKIELLTNEDDFDEVTKYIMERTCNLLKNEPKDVIEKTLKEKFNFNDQRIKFFFTTI